MQVFLLSELSLLNELMLAAHNRARHCNSNTQPSLKRIKSCNHWRFISLKLYFLSFFRASMISVRARARTRVLNTHKSKNWKENQRIFFLHLFNIFMYSKLHFSCYSTNSRGFLSLSCFTSIEFHGCTTPEPHTVKTTASDMCTANVIQKTLRHSVRSDWSRKK